MKSKTNFILTIIFSLIFTTTFAQVKGTVVDETNEVLPGVSVIISGSETGAATDFDGHFELKKVKAGDILIFSYIGYETKKVTINSTSKELHVKMQPSALKMDEVVVVGYSAKKRSELSSAVVVLDEKTINDTPSSDVGSLLQGKIAGVQVVQSTGEPGAASQVRIRGISSISSNDAEPLYIVDGIIGGDFDPNDIESITVLKDAGTTAMYGSRANNGVIVVQTKTGKSGKTIFEFKSDVGVKYADHGNIKMMDGNEFYNWSAEQYRDNTNHEIDLIRFFNDYPRELSKKNYNWVDNAFTPALFHKTYLSAKGSTKKLSYYISGSYTGDEGTFMDTGYQGLNFRTNTTYKFNDRIKMKNNISINTSKGSSFDYMDMLYSYLGVPWDNPYNNDGSPRYVDGNTQDWTSRDHLNPFHNAENSKHNFHGFGASYDMNLSLKLTDWLSFRTTNRLSMYTDKSHNFVSPLAAGNYHDKGFIRDEDNIGYEGISTNIFDFNTAISEHNINGLVGYEYSKNYWEGSHIEGTGIPVGLEVPSVISTVSSVGGENSTGAMESILSQINYNYNHKYFLSASYRMDAASNFPKNNRIAHFPGVSASWLVSNEDFMGKDWMDQLKLRASYGITGDPNIGDHQYLGLFGLNSQYNGNSAATPTQVENLDLTWEKKHQLNFGVDLGLLEKVNLSFDVYKNTTKDLILRIPQPLSQGFEYRYENRGEIENKGFEVSLSTKNINKKNVKWTTDFNFSKNSNVLSGIGDSFQITINGITQIYEDGTDLYTFYLPKWLGVNSDTGAPQWEKLAYDTEGNVTSRTATSDYNEASYQKVGHALPDFTGGITSNLEVFNFTLYTNFTYQYGNDIYNFTRTFMDNDGHEPYYNNMVPNSDWSRWEKPGDIATHPSMQNNALSKEPSSRYLEKGDFFKIRTISLKYSFPKKWLATSKLSHVSIGATANNLFTFTKYWGQDPEVNISRDEFAIPGVSDFKYPNNKQFLLNLDIKF
jgi:TonB-linked SusC/RagA family outer membrane protein